MNILICYNNNFNPIKGGVQRVCDVLTKYFIQNGLKVYYLTADRDVSYESPAPIFVLPNPDFFSEENSIFYKELLQKLAINIVINNDATNERSEFFLKTGIESVYTISLFHQNPLYRLNEKNTNKLLGYFPFYNAILYPKLKRLKRRKQIQHLVSKSDRLVLLSKRFEIGVQEELAVFSNKIVSIANPLTLDKIPLVDVNQKSKKVIFVGRLEMQQKRPEKLIAIWKQIEEVYPEWSLSFIGDGPDRAVLEQMVSSLNLKHVVFEGFKDPLPFYKEASILCMTSDFEGFGLVLLEAMSMGVVPVVFNNWENLQDIVVHNESGFLIKKNDIESYIERIKFLFDNDISRYKMAENAKNQVDNFSINQIGRNWLDLFKNLSLENKASKK